MKKILVIAQREFLMVVLQPAYIITFIGLPLALLLISSMIMLITREAGSGKEQKLIGVLDHAQVLRFDGAETQTPQKPATPQPVPDANVRLIPYTDEQAAMRDLHETKIKGFYVIGADYLQTGVVTVYTRNASLFGGNSDPGQAKLRELLRNSLAQSFAGGAQAEPSHVRRALEWKEVREMNVGSDGKLRPVGSDLVEASRLMLPLITCFLLTSAVFISSGYLLRAVVEEKASRTIEILFSSVTPNQLLWGKIIGLSGAALLQMATYLVLSGITIFSLDSAPNLSPLTLALSLLFATLGFLFYAGMLAGAGIVAGNFRESSQVAAVGGLLAISPMLFISFLLNDPNGTLARILSYIPLTAPVTMVFRLNTTEVPPADQFGAFILLALAAYVAVRGAAKILRTAALMYGKRATLFEVFNWMIRG